MANLPKEFLKKMFFAAKIFGPLSHFLALGGEISYSQEGEDMILKRIFEGKAKGFYVDVGAHHPVRFSNTYYFYKKGWNGINIDPMPGSMDLFNEYRSRDINIEIGVSDQDGYADYYIFEESALNTFDCKLALSRIQSRTSKLHEVKKIRMRSLESILSENLPKSTSIDFMSIDVEGYEDRIIRSNDWNIYHPKVLLVEVLRTSLHDVVSTDISEILFEAGYVSVGKTVNTIFYMDRKFMTKRFGANW